MSTEVNKFKKQIAQKGCADFGPLSVMCRASAVDRI